MGCREQEGQRERRVWHGVRRGDFVCDDRNSKVTIWLALRTREEVERRGFEGANQRGAVDGNREERKRTEWY